MIYRHCTAISLQLVLKGAAFLCVRLCLFRLYLFINWLRLLILRANCQLFFIAIYRNSIREI